MKKMETSFKSSHAATAAFGAPNPAADHRPTLPLETPGHSRASLGQSLVGSLLLSPGSWCTQSFVCVLQESVSPGLSKSWSSVEGLTAASSKRGYAIPRSATSRAPAPVAGHCWPVPLQETLKNSLVQSLCGLWVPLHTRFVWALWASLEGMRFDSKHDFSPPTTLQGLFLCPWM